MPVIFLPVWVGVAVLLGWIGWRTQREGWFAVAFAWLVLVGPICWLMVGAALS
jgi:chromate transport protein ChrA